MGINFAKLYESKLNDWEMSIYDGADTYKLAYYLNEDSCNEGDVAYVYDEEVDEVKELEIVKTIRRSANIAYYHEIIQNRDVLLDGETRYKADTSAEFITDNDCYLVWFKYIE